MRLTHHFVQIKVMIKSWTLPRSKLINVLDTKDEEGAVQYQSLN